MTDTHRGRRYCGRAPARSQAILDKLTSLPIQTWNDKSQPETQRHLGPLAQDFRAAFALGRDDKHISMVGPDGVALAAIQGLYQIVQEADHEDLHSEALRGVRILCALSKSAIYARFALWEAIDE